MEKLAEIKQMELKFSWIILAHLIKIKSDVGFVNAGHNFGRN